MNDIKILEDLFAAYIMLSFAYQNSSGATKVYLRETLKSLHVCFELIFEKVIR